MIQETETNVIDLTDDGLPFIQCLIQFLYSGTYGLENTVAAVTKPRPSSSIAENFDSLRFSLHANMYSIADKYDIGELKTFSKEALDSALLHKWEPKLFAECVPIIYTSTPDGDRSLRDLAVEYARNNKTDFADREPSNPCFRKLYETAPLFIRDLLETYINTVEYHNWSRLC